LGIFCIGYNITEHIDTRSRLNDATSEIAVKNDKLSEIGFMQSHVIRKPLANIIGLAGIMSETDLDESQKSIMEKMLSSAEELDLVVREISDKAD